MSDTTNTENTESAVSGEVLEAAAPVAELQARIAQLEKETVDLRDQLLRSVADYKNFKRRTDSERSDLIRSASASLLVKLIPVMDDLERANASIPAELAENPWFGGFRLIPQKLTIVLESEGITPIEAVGKEFNPTFHEAVIFEEGGDGQKVVAELQRGYLLHDKVLRPTMVKVG